MRTLIIAIIAITLSSSSQADASWKVSIRTDLSDVVLDMQTIGLEPEVMQMHDGVAHWMGSESPNEVHFCGLMTHEAIEKLIKDTNVLVQLQKVNEDRVHPDNVSRLYLVARVSTTTLQVFPVVFESSADGWRVGHVTFSQKAEDWSPWPSSE